MTIKCFTPIPIPVQSQANSQPQTVHTPKVNHKQDYTIIPATSCQLRSSSSDVTACTSSLPRPYRCSRCGKIGHNIRRCTLSHPYYRQRCGRCGSPGHNARNCPLLDKEPGMKCRVCKGASKLCCSSCNGAGFHTKQINEIHIQPTNWQEDNLKVKVHKPTLNDRQKCMAERARRRVRGLLDEVVYSDHGEHEDLLIGGRSVVDVRKGKGKHFVGSIRDKNNRIRCERCMGRGFLSCMACSE